jgi:hypothetical protein
MGISVPNGFYVGLTAEARRRRVKPSERRNQNEHLLRLLFSSLHLCASAVIFKKSLGTKEWEYNLKDDFGTLLRAMVLDAP